MRNYEVTFIVDPVLSGSEITSTANTYKDLIKGEGGKITHTDELGLRQLAYPIKKRNTGIYFCIEFEMAIGNFVDRLELALRRDERIMRFLCVKLDKFGVKYNDDKRNGLIGKVKVKVVKEEVKRDSRGPAKPRPAPKAAAPVEATAPEAQAAKPVEPAAPVEATAPEAPAAKPVEPAAPVEATAPEAPAAKPVEPAAPAEEVKTGEE